MKYFYAAPVHEGNTISEEGIKSDDRGVIELIALKEGFLMQKFVFDVYSSEVIGSDEYSLFEISPEGIVGQITKTDKENFLADFFIVVMQPFIETVHLKRLTTDRYEGMGLDIGIHLVENKEKFTDDYKQKILGSYQALD